MNKLYIIEYYINGRLIETINLNNPKPRSTCKNICNRLSNSTHRLGLLILKEVK